MGQMDLASGAMLLYLMHSALGNICITKAEDIWLAAGQEVYPLLVLFLLDVARLRRHLLRVRWFLCGLQYLLIQQGLDPSTLRATECVDLYSQSTYGECSASRVKLRDKHSESAHLLLPSDLLCPDIQYADPLLH